MSNMINNVIARDIFDDFKNIKQESRSATKEELDAFMKVLGIGYNHGSVDLKSIYEKGSLTKNIYTVNEYVEGDYKAIDLKYVSYEFTSDEIDFVLYNGEGALYNYYWDNEWYGEPVYLRYVNEYDISINMEFNDKKLNNSGEVSTVGGVFGHSEVVEDGVLHVSPLDNLHLDEFTL